jgi:hypothetical protein
MRKKITINTPNPHSENQRKLISAFVEPHYEEILIACGTKWGKTTGAASSFAAVAPIVQGSLWRWVAPILTQAKIGFNYCRKMLPAEPYCSINRSQLPTITVNSMDSRIEFWHAQNAESLEGEAVFGYVFDEAAKMTESVYESAHTTTTITRGPKVLISTPKGKNWFFRKCMEAHEEYTYAIEKGIKPKKIFITAPSTDNPAVTPEAISQARATLPQRLFEQYYEARFVDDGETFSNYKQCLYGPELLVSGSRQIWFNEQKKEGNKIQAKVVIGVDWAKKVDFTVMTAWDYSENKMIGFLRFQNVNYFEAIKQLVWFCKHFTKVDMIFHDKTGLGEVIDDMLDQTSLPYEGIIFTNTSKSHMVNSLILACEQGIPLFPHWPEMIKEFDSYEVTTTDAGSMKYAAPEGMHDDIVSSMILGWKVVMEYSNHELSVKTVETLSSDKKLTVADWYQEIQQQNDEDFGGWIDLKGLR